MHPARLFKQALCEYLRTYVPPGLPAGTAPAFGEESGFIVTHDEEGITLDGSDRDLLVMETAAAQEVAEGLGVWTLSIQIAATIPGDELPANVRDLQDTLWSHLTGQYAGDASTGGDIPGPLAGRLNALALHLHQDDPQAWPRILCVGDVWRVAKQPPELDGPAVRISMATLQANAEIMPPNYHPVPILYQSGT